MDLTAVQISELTKLERKTVKQDFYNYSEKEYWNW